jgi:hypothetical protein
MWLDRSGARLLAFELGRLKRSCFVLQDGIDKPSVPFAALKDADFVLAQIWIGGETGIIKFYGSGTAGTPARKVLPVTCLTCLSLSAI